GEIKALQLPRYNFPTRCRFVLGNMNVQALYRSLPTPLLSFLTARDQKKVADLDPLERRGLVQYEVPRDFLPGPMKENLIAVGDRLMTLEGDNCLELNAYPLTKAASPDADTLLTVSYTVRDKMEGSFNDLHDRIDEQLRRLIPFAGTRLRRVFPAVEAAAE